MKAVVTGAAGFIGSHICERLLETGHAVLGVDNLSTGRLENLRTFEVHSGFSFMQADVTVPEVCARATSGADWVFHVAGLAGIQPSFDDPVGYFHHNVTGTLMMLQAARKNGVKRFVYAASSSCYGLPSQFPTNETSPIQPESPYALTKRQGEELVLHWAQVFGLGTVSLRLFNVFGPRGCTGGPYSAVFNVFLKQRDQGQPLTIVGDGKQTRDFIYVSDVAAAFLAAACSEHSGVCFNVGRGESHSVNELAELMGSDRTHLPKRPGEAARSLADISKIRASLDWSPKISFAEGVARLLAAPVG